MGYEARFAEQSAASRFLQGAGAGCVCLVLGIGVLAGGAAIVNGSSNNAEAVGAIVIVIGICFAFACGGYPCYLWYKHRNRPVGTPYGVIDYPQAKALPPPQPAPQRAPQQYYYAQPQPAPPPRYYAAPQAPPPPPGYYIAPQPVPQPPPQRRGWFGF
jgi:hypothetical protein